MIFARSPAAHAAHQLVSALQRRMVGAQEQVAHAAGEADQFRELTWGRDEGRHGGGARWSVVDTKVFDRASVNVSQVHYDDEPSKRLSSATALSTIIHPRHPHAPSVHLHVSWTEMRDGSGYWRIMADLNPSIPDTAQALRGKADFLAALRAAAPAVFDEATRQGDRYFFIPALERHRGVAHFYLEQYATADRDADAALARAVGEAAIDQHASIVGEALRAHGPASIEARARQLAYHTVYLFQVLTLDRGTTSGLLIHDQNDVGILGSLPSQVDRALLASWRSRVPSPVDQLVDRLLGALPAGDVVTVDDVTKRALATAVRAFYQANPQALDLQARGDVVPPTVSNHRS
ncbi:MAG: coproporphyrinogen III oxidase [Proteobacteria bacterium]|nr:coproporphyrinogen III oxidase [Pseudomonadota bacterium]